MVPLIEQNLAQIESLCRKYRVKRLDLFGSAARGEFDPRRSDFDFLYEFEDADSAGIADRFFGLMDDLERLLGARVDLVSSKDARNPYFLEAANRDRLPLYAA